MMINTRGREQIMLHGKRIVAGLGSSYQWSRGRPAARSIAVVLMTAPLLTSLSAHAISLGSGTARLLSLSAYVFVICGILLLPAQAPHNANTARLAMDSLLATCALAAFSWYFVIGPMTLGRALDGALAARLAYPVFDLALVLALLLISANLREPVLRRTAAALSLGVIEIVGSDTVRLYAGVHRMPVPAVPSRVLGFALCALGAWMAWIIVNRDSLNPSLFSHAGFAGAGTPSIWRYLLPWALVPPVVALMIYVARMHASGDLQEGVFIAGGTMIELVFVHQFLAYRELMRYSNKSTRLESLAATDPVTGLPNHRTIISTLNKALGHAQLHNEPCSLLFLDLDHFKTLNDTFGHRSGDAALREFASVSRQALRASDVLGRWGGEEFVALLPNTDVDTARAIAERIRMAVSRHAFVAMGGGHITCSIGMASFPHHAHDRDHLVELGDRAMYSAKRLGRNRVCGVDEIGDGGERRDASRDDVAVSGIVDALASLLNANDPTAAERAVEVGSLARRLGNAMNLDARESRMLELAGRILDIGTVTMSLEVRRKSAPLADDEWSAMRAHPVLSASIVERIPALRVLAPTIRAHHERWDGDGYPDNLAGQAIPLGGRILAVADAYVAMTFDRPHQPARTPHQAVKEIQECAGTQFDPAVVQSLATLIALEYVQSA